MRIFFVSFVLIFTLLYQAWGQHFLVKTKDNDKSFLIKTKDDHIEPIEGNEANKAEEELKPYWLKNKCEGIICGYREGRWMRRGCIGEKIKTWIINSWNKCLKVCRRTTKSTGCAYHFPQKKCRVFKGEIKTKNITKKMTKMKKYSTMCIVFPEKIIETDLDKLFPKTLEKAAKKFDFIWGTDNPGYWCYERSAEIWDLWCRNYRKICKKIHKKYVPELKYVPEFCEKKRQEKGISCRKQEKSSTKMSISISCDLQNYWGTGLKQMMSFGGHA